MRETSPAGGVSSRFPTDREFMLGLIEIGLCFRTSDPRKIIFQELLFKRRVSLYRDMLHIHLVHSLRCSC